MYKANIYCTNIWHPCSSPLQVLHGLTENARAVPEEEDEFSQDTTETGCLVTLCRLHYFMFIFSSNGEILWRRHMSMLIDTWGRHVCASGWIVLLAQTYVDFWKANRFPFCRNSTCLQPGRWCCCVGSTHTQWPAYAPWALGYRRTWFLVWCADTFWHVYCVLVMQLHTIYGWICAFCVFMCLLQPTWTGSLVIVLFWCPLLFAHFCTGLC